MNNSIKEWSLQRLSATAILAAIAWNLTNFAMNVLNLAFLSKLRSDSIDFAKLNYANLWGDRVGWAHLAGSWLSLTVPVVVVAFLAICRVDLTWRRAAAIGLAIVGIQILFMGGARLVRFHSPVFAADYLIYYLARFWIVLPGVFAAAAAWHIDLDAKLLTA